MNARDAGPLAGWKIVQAQGLTLIGRWHDAAGGAVLEPSYKLEVKIERAGGGLSVRHICFPLFMLASIRRTPVPPGALLWDMEELSRQELMSLARSVQECEEAVQLVRAEQAGVRLARPGEPLPPKPGS